MSRRELFAMATLSAGASIAIPAQAATTLQSLTTKDWRDDLESLFDQLRRNHRDLFHHTPVGRFQAAVADLHRRIPGLGPMEVVAGLQSIVALAGDGHTFAFTWDLYRPFPFDTAWFGDELRVVRATPATKHLLGLKVDRVDGMPIAEVNQRLNAVIAQAENPWYVLAQRPDRLRRAELLAALGVIRSPERMTLDGVDVTGRPKRVEVVPMPLGTTDDRLSVALGPTKPERPDPSFAWARLPGQDAVHVNFRSYDRLPERAAALFADIRAAPPRTLLIDLRQNGGGNYTLPREHIIVPLQTMPALNRKGRLYVLIGRHTFSAAMTNASDFWRETEATLAGEPTGARPNGFQELHTFLLAKSKLRVACSIQAYRFDSAGRDAIYPDLSVTTNWESFLQGRDEVIEAAFAHSRGFD